MANVNIETNWTFIKNLVDNAGTKLHYTENDSEYRIFTFNGQILYETYLFKDSGSIILEDATQNDSDLNDFETNYKAGANTLDKVKVQAEFESNQEIYISGQAISNTLRVAQMTTNQDIANGSYTTVYSYSGSGSFFGLFIETSDSDMFLELSIDGVKIIDGLNIGGIPVVGPGNSGNGPELSTGFWRSATTQVNYKPPLGVKYSSSITIKLKATTPGKKLSNGYISLSKVT